MEEDKPMSDDEGVNIDVENDDGDDDEHFYDEDPDAVVESSFILTPVHSKDAVTVAISNRSGFIATGGCDDLALLFKAEYSTKLPRMVYPAKDTVSLLTFDPNGFYLGFAAADHVYVVPLNNLDYARPLEADAEVSLLCWSPICTGKYSYEDFILAVCPSLQYVWRIQIEPEALNPTNGFYFSGEKPTSIQMTSDAKVAAMTFEDGQIITYDPQQMHQLTSHKFRDPILTTCFGVDNMVACGLNCGNIAVCQLVNRSKIKIIAYVGEQKKEENPVEAICFSLNPQRRYVAFGTLGGDIELHTIQARNSLLAKYSVGNTSILKLCFDEHADRLYAGTYDGSLYVFDVHSEQTLDVYYSRGKITTFAFAMMATHNKEHKMLACSVSAKGQLRYFLDPFVPLPSETDDIIIEEE